MVNYILLEGFEVYVWLILVLAISVFGFVGFLTAIKRDIKAEEIKNELYEERKKNIYLNRDNMRLKLKCGELKAGEKVDV